MGVLSWTFSQVCMSSLVLGALKRKGVVVLKPEAIVNDTLRSGLVTAVRKERVLAHRTCA
jgi:hypothetical protein